MQAPESLQSHSNEILQMHSNEIPFLLFWGLKGVPYQEKLKESDPFWFPGGHAHLSSSKEPAKKISSSSKEPAKAFK